MGSAETGTPSRSRGSLVEGARVGGRVLAAVAVRLGSGVVLGSDVLVTVGVADEVIVAVGALVLVAEGRGVADGGSGVGVSVGGSGVWVGISVRIFATRVAISASLTPAAGALVSWQPVNSIVTRMKMSPFFIIVSV